MSGYTPIKRKLYTLVMPLDLENKRILLGYKKRGFGMGKCESRLPCLGEIGEIGYVAHSNDRQWLRWKSGRG